MKCPKCPGLLQAVHLPGGVEVESCANCCGVYYDLAELAVPVELDCLTHSAYICPKCYGAMAVGTLYGGKLTVEQCQGCRGLWLDPGEVQKLRRLSGTERIVGRPEKEDAPAALSAFAAELKSRAPARPEPGGKSAKGDDDGPVKASDSAALDHPDWLRRPAPEHEGRRYEHFQTAAPVVCYALGEFNWKVKVGERSIARDFVSPPYLLSEDKTKDESVWTHGEYLEPWEVWNAFGLEGAPPPRRGVAPAQPNPHAESRASISAWFWWCAWLCLGLFLAFNSIAQKKTVLREAWSQALADPEKSRVSQPFELGGRVSNVRVETRTDLSNNWAYFRMALINTDTDEALDFGREVSYYRGTDGGESWSEGSSMDRVTLPGVKPGRYYLRVEPETAAQGLRYEITLIRDVPQWRQLVAAVLLLALPFLWVRWRHYSFEFDRWEESDHPWSASEEDDDDE